MSKLLNVFKRKAAHHDPAAVAPEVPAGARDIDKEAEMAVPKNSAGSDKNPKTAPDAKPEPKPEAAADDAAAAEGGAVDHADVEIKPAAATAPAPVAATIDELETAFPDSPKLVLEAYKGKYTMAAAYKLAYLQEKQRAESLGKLGKAGLAGTDPVGAAPPNAGGAKPAGSNAIEAYDAAVKVTAKEKKISIGAATALVNAEQPELRKAYIEAAEKSRK